MDTLAIVPHWAGPLLADSREAGPLRRTAGGRSVARARPRSRPLALSCRLGALHLPVFDGRFLQAGWQVVRLGKASSSGLCNHASWGDDNVVDPEAHRLHQLLPCAQDSLLGILQVRPGIPFRSWPGSLSWSAHHVQGRLQAHSRA